jgi:hypothetical protein
MEYDEHVKAYHRAREIRAFQDRLFLDWWYSGAPFVPLPG